MALNKKLVRNISVPVRATTKIVSSPNQSVCQNNDNDVEYLTQANSTLKLLKDIKNLKECDLDLESDDDDIPYSALNFDSNDHLYNDLVKLDISSKCQTKRTEYVSKPRNDALPDIKDFLNYTLHPEYKFHNVIVTPTPDENKIKCKHSFYERKKYWK